MNIKKKRILFVVGIMILMCCVFAGSYAFWTVTKEQRDTNDIVASCLKLELIEESGTFGVNNAWPITDTEGMALEGYSFKIKNNCTETVNYIIGIDSLAIEGADYLDYQSIKVSLDSTSPKLFSNLTNIERDNVRDSKQVEIKSIEGNTTNSHNIKLWIKNDADVSEESKQFKGQVFITGGQGINGPIMPNIPVPNGSVIISGDCSKDSESNNTYALYSSGDLYFRGTGEVLFSKYDGKEWDSIFPEKIEESFAARNESLNITGDLANAYLELYNLGMQSSNYESFSHMMVVYLNNGDDYNFSNVKDMYVSMGVVSQEVADTLTEEQLVTNYEKPFLTGMLAQLSPDISYESAISAMEYGKAFAIKRIIISEGITEISKDAFTGMLDGNQKFILSEDIVLPSTFKKLNNSVFEDIDANIVLNDGLEYIESYALENQKGIVRIPDSIIGIGENAFGENVTELYLPNQNNYAYSSVESQKAKEELPFEVHVENANMTRNSGASDFIASFSGYNVNICGNCTNLVKVHLPEKMNIGIAGVLYAGVSGGNKKMYYLVADPNVINYKLVMPYTEEEYNNLIDVYKDPKLLYARYRNDNYAAPGCRDLPVEWDGQIVYQNYCDYTEVFINSVFNKYSNLPLREDGKGANYEVLDSYYTREQILWKE